MASFSSNQSPHSASNDCDCDDVENPSAGELCERASALHDLTEGDAQRLRVWLAHQFDVTPHTADINTDTNTDTTGANIDESVIDKRVKLLQSRSFAFLRTDVVAFVGALDLGVSFAHDRGLMNNSKYSCGTFDCSFSCSFSFILFYFF